MVDIHSHILPGLDDGATTLDESLEMLRIAADSGTTDIVATPHANLDFKFSLEIVEEDLDQLRAANTTAIRIHYGCDFHLDYDLIQDALAHPRKYTVNHGPYLLIELPNIFQPRIVPSILDNLMRHDMRPILTHPERYRALRGKLDELREWSAMGCLLQVTAQSLLGSFGSDARKMSEQLLAEGMVDFIASDAHDPLKRTPRLAEARQWVVKHYSEPDAVRLFETNPRATLTGDPLPSR